MDPDTLANRFMFLDLLQTVQKLQAQVRQLQLQNAKQLADQEALRSEIAGLRLNQQATYKPAITNISDHNIISKYYVAEK